MPSFAERIPAGNVIRGAVGELIFHNRYSYANSNPVNLTDPSGMIPEKEKITGPDYDYTYSCNCGWIDWKHANPDITANRIISLVTQAYEYYVREGNNARIARLSAWDLSHDISIPNPFGPAVLVGTYHEDIYIDCGITRADILPVAMAIFRSVELAHEGSIPSHLSFAFPDSWTHYAEEDLTSNLIAFYRAAYPAYNARYGEDACLPTICDYPHDEAVGQAWSN
ncbi:hypothetical protein HC928_10430 [bacterium]|nr:hypothetical protein [bacterium]